jgi:hypothetical protein
MNLPFGQPPPPAPAKLKLTPGDRRARQADRVTTVRPRMLIGRKLENRGSTTSADIRAALGIPVAEMTGCSRGSIVPPRRQNFDPPSATASSTHSATLHGRPKPN